MLIGNDNFYLEWDLYEIWNFILQPLRIDQSGFSLILGKSLWLTSIGLASASCYQAPKYCRGRHLLRQHRWLISTRQRTTVQNSGLKLSGMRIWTSLVKSIAAVFCFCGPVGPFDLVRFPDPLREYDLQRSYILSQENFLYNDFVLETRFSLNKINPKNSGKKKTKNALKT